MSEWVRINLPQDHWTLAWLLVVILFSAAIVSVAALLNYRDKKRNP